MSHLAKHLPKLNASASRLYRTLRLYWWNGSLRAWGVLFSHMCRRLLTRSAPSFLAMALTNRCQCHCGHCRAAAPDSSTDGELDTGQVKTVIDQAKRIGTAQVFFTGGEPLLRKDLAELVRHTHDAGLITRVSTNGLLLNRERARELRKAGLTLCGVSIDNADAEAHDRSRGVPGAYEKTLAGIENLRRVGIPCQILTYASTRLGVAGLARIIALGKQLGARCCIGLFPVGVGRLDGAPDPMPTDEQVTRMRELQDVSFFYLEMPTSQSLCSISARAALSVNAEGDVTPCPFVPYALGNVRTDSLPDLWRRHCARLSLSFRGSCPMNEPRDREVLREQIEGGRS